MNKLFSVLRGPYQSCEDSVCSECGKYTSIGKFAQCKKECIQTRQPEIRDCCVKMCSSQRECVDACVPIQYGNYNQNPIGYVFTPVAGPLANAGRRHAILYEQEPFVRYV